MLATREMNLRRLYEERGAEETTKLLAESIREKTLKCEDFSLRELAEAFVEGGHRSFMPAAMRARQPMLMMEAPVDSTAFLNIMGQIVYSKINQAYQEADAGVFEQLFDVQNTIFNGEKIPGMGKILDEEFTVGEDEEYPETGFGEDYQETPETVKHGLRCSVTREMVYFDRTNLALRRCASIGERLATARLKRGLKVIIGAVNNYNWRGTAYNTYLTSGGWINDHVNALADYTDIVNAWKLFQEITDPDTGNPIVVGGTQLLCCPGNLHNARRVVTSIQVRVSGSNIETLSANPIAGDVDSPISSALLYQLLQSELSYSAANAAATWFYGNFKKTFWYMQNWPLTVVQRPRNNDDEFKRDRVGEWRADERGVAVTGNPRFVTRNRNA